MLDEKRVRRMTRLASYEAKEGKEDIEISMYFKKDYIGLNHIKSLLWVTIGYVFLVALLGITFLEVLMENFTIGKLIAIVSIVLVLYIVLMILYGIWTKKFYRRKHDEARERVKRYCHHLLMLEKLYEKENL